MTGPLCSPIQPKQVFFAKVDVDEMEDAATAAGVTSMPTFKLFRHGKQMGGGVSGVDQGKLRALLSKAFEAC